MPLDLRDQWFIGTRALMGNRLLHRITELDWKIPVCLNRWDGGTLPVH